MANIQIENLTFTYPGREQPALKDVSLSIRQGEYVALCGRSGSGKTTLLRHLKPVLAPHGKTSGTVTLDGTAISALPQRDQAACIGYVMQNPDDQIVTDKVWHELAFGLESLGCPQKTMRARVAEMACYFGIQDWFHRDVAELSGGQKQLLNLASVMAMQPEILILDEPTSQLDPIAASDFLNTVRKINLELGTTVLISEHRLEDILPAADRAVVMEQGELVADAAPRDIGRILFEQNHPMFAAMPAPVRTFFAVGGAGECPLTVREGRQWLENAIPEPVRVPELPEKVTFNGEEPAALTIREAWFRYEKDTPDILRGVDVSIPAGSFFAIVGGNGAGKSTLLKSVCGICRPYRGKIAVFGKNVEKYKNGSLFDHCLAMLPQDPKCLFVGKTLRADLEEMTKDPEKIAQAAELCQVTHLLDAHPYDLSGGEQQRGALAKVLLTEPKLLLLDEPTKGIDSFFKDKLAGVLAQLRSRGVTIVMVSHDVEFCAKYADLVGMFFDGQMLTTDTPRSFFGGNSFYTTTANRMSRHRFRNAVTAEDVAELFQKNQEEKA